MDRDYLQEALHTFNTNTPNWYGWKKFDEQGNKIPNSERMQYQHIKIIKEGATIPTEAEVNAKIAELKQAETDREARKASAKSKLEALGLTTEEIKEAFGI
tara:strand:- start:756 stop:1058 length:303 start_codon:yes stop_codon:yes gene_type:complete